MNGFGFHLAGAIVQVGNQISHSNDPGEFSIVMPNKNKYKGCSWPRLGRAGPGRSNPGLARL